MTIKEYKDHCASIEASIVLRTEQYKEAIIIAIIDFCFLLPTFIPTVKEHIGVSLEARQFRNDFKFKLLEAYKLASQKAMEAMDPYTDDYEEIEAYDLLLLNLFDALLMEDSTHTILNLFNGIIELLDYYVQFSERPDYWNRLLGEELLRQIEVLNAKQLSADFYTQAYKTVVFEKL